MHYRQLFVISTALAGLSAVASRSQTPLAEKWTIESMKRSCDGNDTICTWSFRVNTHAKGIDPTPVDYIVNATDNRYASRSTGGPSKFGIFTVTSTWQDFFGLEEAWTTLSVIDYDRKLLVYPAYTDKQVRGGRVVDPDQTYTPENVPA